MMTQKNLFSRIFHFFTISSLIVGSYMVLLFGPVVTSAEGDETLVLYYKFDQLGPNGQVMDDSGTGNNGKIVGNVKKAKGKIADGLDFGDRREIVLDKGDYVDVPHSPSLDLTEVYTVAVWVNFDSITGEFHQFYFDKGADDKSPGGWRLGKVKSGNTRWQIFKDGSWKQLDAVWLLKEKTWYHIAVTRDAKETTKIYINGQDLATSKTVGEVPTNNNTLTVGGSAKFKFDMFMGTLDELVIYNGKALSVDEIKQLMKKGALDVDVKGKVTTTWGRIKARD